MSDEIKCFENNGDDIDSLPLFGVMISLPLDSLPINAINNRNQQIHSSSYLCDSPFMDNDDALIKNNFFNTHCDYYWDESATPPNTNLPNAINFTQMDLNVPYTKNSPCWCLSMSPNNYLAWNAGNGQLFLIPIINFNFSNNVFTNFTNANNANNDKSFTKKSNISHSLKQSLTIDCGSIIWSMEFGSYNQTSSKHYQMFKIYPEQFLKIFSMINGNNISQNTCLNRKKTDENDNPYVTDVYNYLYNSAFKHSPVDANGKIRNCFDFTQEECILATGLANGQIKIWQIPSGRLMLLLYDHKYPVSSLHFAPNPRDFRLLSGSVDRTMKVWDMNQDGNMAPTIDAFKYQSRILCARWYPHLSPYQGTPKIISVGGSNKAYIWKQQTLKGSSTAHSFVLCKILIGHLNEIVDCDFSSDGALLVTASRDSYAILWDPYTYEALKKFSHVFPAPRPIFASGYNNHGLRGVKFINDNHAFVSVADDGYVRVWDIYKQSENPSRIGRQDYPLCCRFSSKPGIIATGDKFGRLMIWGICDSHYHMGPQGSKNILCQHRKLLRRPTSHYNSSVSDFEESIFQKPYKLQHLCRLTVRTLVPDSKLLERYFNVISKETLIPHKLVAYLLYKDVRVQDQVVSPNYPYIVN